MDTCDSFPLCELCTTPERPAAKDLQMKMETNDNLCRISALLVSEINNSVLGSPSTSELCPALPLAKIKLESSTIEKNPSLSMDSFGGVFYLSIINKQIPVWVNVWNSCVREFS
jgi:hypothetical protein